MVVRIERRDRDGELEFIEEVELTVYCDRGYQDVIKVLYSIEESLKKQGIDTSKDRDFQNIRHRLLDIAGGIKRLPHTLEGD